MQTIEQTNAVRRRAAPKPLAGPHKGGRVSNGYISRVLRITRETKRIAELCSNRYNIEIADETDERGFARYRLRSKATLFRPAGVAPMRFLAWLFRPRCKHAWVTVCALESRHQVCIYCKRTRDAAGANSLPGIGGDGGGCGGEGCASG